MKKRTKKPTKPQQTPDTERLTYAMYDLEKRITVLVDAIDELRELLEHKWENEPLKE